jgi:uncharacterized membrane protein
MVTFAERPRAAHAARTGGRDAGRATNVHRLERIASAVGGAALVTLGARRRGMGGTVLAVIGGVLLERAVTGHCRVYDALGIDTAAEREGLPEKRHGPAAVLDASHAIRVERAVTIDRPASELYAFWRRLDNLPRLMRHLESVEVLSNGRSRWRARGPAGQVVEWEAEIINDIPDELIAWKSAPDATVPNAGSVHFAPAARGRGTEVRVLLEYDPPAGRLGAMVAKLFGEEPDQQVREDLLRFKRVMESGEVETSDWR